MSTHQAGVKTVPSKQASGQWAGDGLQRVYSALPDGGAIGAAVGRVISDRLDYLGKQAAHRRVGRASSSPLFTHTGGGDTTSLGMWQTMTILSAPQASPAPQTPR